MVPLRCLHVALVLLASHTLAFAFQPLARRTSVSLIFSSSPQRASVTLLRAVKAKGDQLNATEAIAVIKAEPGWAYTEQAVQQEQHLLKTFDLSEGIIINNQATVEQVNPLEGLLWRGSVFLLCALWASNFSMAKMIMAEPGVDSSLYTVTRFGIAALALAPFAIISTRRTGMDWETLRGAVICGSWVAFGYLGQTLGLLSTTASRSCVICSLHCVFVAVVAELVRVNRAKDTMMESTNFDFKRLVPAAIAVAGVAVVELHGAAGAPTTGDLISFAQPVGFGLGYLLLGEIMAKRPDTAMAVSAIKLAVVAVASFAMFELTPLIQNGADSWSFAVPDFSAILASKVALGGVLYTGLITTALALWVESKAFVRVPATDASLILTTEPLFAAALGAVTLGETFGFYDYTGASLIIGACIMATLLDGGSRDVECPPESEECEAVKSSPGRF